jgi:predicted exporter
MSSSKYVILILSFILYVSSMACVAVYDGHEELHGFLLFILGAVLVGMAPTYYSLILFAIWLANPLLWLAWINIKKNKKALYFSLASSVLSLCFLLLSSEEFILGPAYYLWLISSLIVFFGYLSLMTPNKNSKMYKSWDNFLKESFPPNNELS